MGFQAVTDWLNSSDKNFAEGAEIFCRHTRNKNLIRLFQTEHPNAYTRQKLLYEMQKLAPVLAKTEALPAQKPTPKPPVSAAPVPGVVKQADPFPSKYEAEKEQQFAGLWVGEWEKLPDPIKDRINALKDLAKEQDALRHRLRDMGNDEAEAAALRIMDIEDELKAIRKEVLHYKATGELPKEKAKPEEKDVLKKISRRNTLRTYVSRDSKALAEKPNDKKLKDKLEKWKTELAALEAELE